MGGSSQTVDWSSLVLSDWINRLDRMALKRFGQQVIADEAVNHVLEQLAANNWAVLDGYQNRAQPKTYLNVVATHLLEEFSRKKFGRPRPPQWLKRNGHLWVSIWKQLCLERQQNSQVIFNWLSAERSRDYIESIVSAIKARVPWCGVKTEEVPTSALARDDEQGDFEIVDQRSADPEPQDTLEELLLVIRLLLISETALPGIDALQLQRVRSVTKALNDELKLSVEERLVMKMVFIDRIKHKLVAEGLGLKPYQLSKRLSALYARLREAIEKTGFEKDSVF